MRTLLHCSDIFVEFRIDAVLQEMSCLTLVELPEDEPWTVNDFLENTKKLCTHGASELQTKSLNVEDATNELINMLLTLPESDDEDDGMEEEANSEGEFSYAAFK